MSYRAGTMGLGHLGLQDGEPRITCDGCDIVRPVPRPPPRWFLDRKPAKGWARSENDRGQSVDICPRCVAAALEEVHP